SSDVATSPLIVHLMQERYSVEAKYLSTRTGIAAEFEITKVMAASARACRTACGRRAGWHPRRPWLKAAGRGAPGPPRCDTGSGGPETGLRSGGRDGRFIRRDHWTDVGDERPCGPVEVNPAEVALLGRESSG